MMTVTITDETQTVFDSPAQQFSPGDGHASAVLADEIIYLIRP